MRLMFVMCMNEDYNECIESELESVAESLGVSKSEFQLSAHREYNPTDRLLSHNLRDYYCSLVTGHSTNGLYDYDKTEQDIFLYASVPSVHVAKSIFSKCILVKQLVNIWTDAESYETLLKSIKEDDIETYLKPTNTWAIRYSTYNRKSSQDDLVSVCDKFSAILSRAGNVDLANPNVKIAIMENYSTDNKTGEKKLKRVYIGNIIMEREDIGYWWRPFSLSNRPILGPTSLDNTLAFIMCNLGMIDKGSVVLDPFVGSGGSLITATALGAQCWGCDIDARVLMGWGISYKNPNVLKNEYSSDIFSNFKFYGLPIPEILRIDNQHSAWRMYRTFEGKLLSCNGNSISKEWVDVIIADPPYGNRASAKHKRITNQSDDEIVSCLVEILLDMAEALLVPKGRIVFLLPSHRDSITQDLKTLRRSRLAIKHIGKQNLAAGIARFIVVMEKQSTIH
ncbi:bifunctional S-adenosyl-L-methionine-dependent methyltransferase superfamily/DNA methylase [Babesia duncani]|uniref:Bifunctional S-adenosyl-L-methionine-dependent methyltransferase superfamily/DNA methylase n=1 Tax=Babesia duncani TaxID=323732 RepID=A0AAD9PIY2_9APIC|nr:bifunctional S-adenosyl-L-methionine-dependent methyltransferase superfamily/DNA methylase [Babesia duncani]